MNRQIRAQRDQKRVEEGTTRLAEVIADITKPYEEDGMFGKAFGLIRSVGIEIGTQVLSGAITASFQRIGAVRAFLLNRIEKLEARMEALQNQIDTDRGKTQGKIGSLRCDLGALDRRILNVEKQARKFSDGIAAINPEILAKLEITYEETNGKIEKISAIDAIIRLVEEVAELRARRKGRAARKMDEEIGAPIPIGIEIAEGRRERIEELKLAEKKARKILEEARGEVKRAVEEKEKLKAATSELRRSFEDLRGKFETLAGDIAVVRANANGTSSPSATSTAAETIQEAAGATSSEPAAAPRAPFIAPRLISSAVKDTAPPVVINADSAIAHTAARIDTIGELEIQQRNANVNLDNGIVEKINETLATQIQQLTIALGENQGMLTPAEEAQWSSDIPLPAEILLDGASEKLSELFIEGKLTIMIVASIRMGAINSVDADEIKKPFDKYGSPQQITSDLTNRLMIIARGFVRIGAMDQEVAGRIESFAKE